MFFGNLWYEAIIFCVVLGIMIKCSTLSAVFQRTKDLLQCIVIILAAFIVYVYSPFECSSSIHEWSPGWI